MDAPVAVLSARRADILRHYRHPWVFSQGVLNKDELPEPTTVRVTSENGEHLGWAFYHPENAICLRLLTFEEQPMTDQDWQSRIRQTLEMRRGLLGDAVEGFRLIHGENDGFPGLKVDVYRELLVMQIMCAGMDHMSQNLSKWLLEATGGKAVFERSEGHARILYLMIAWQNRTRQIQKAGFILKHHAVPL